MKQNYRFTIMYDGTRYFGWEHQPNTDMTIQGKIETVLGRMLAGVAMGKTSDKPLNHTIDNKESDGTDSIDIKSFIPELIGAGRTDAGVHAENMIANAFMDVEMSVEEIRDYMNRYLPEDICIKEVALAGDRFHSRYNALGKTYRYTCYVGDSKPVFDRKYVYELDKMPDLEAMRKAAEILKGEHDFRSFCSNPKMKKSTVRLVDRIDIEKKGDYLTFTYHGSGFLQYMVRILTGTLLEVGFGKRTPESMGELLEARDRKLAGETAPAKGLRMMKVDYH